LPQLGDAAEVCAGLRLSARSEGTGAPPSSSPAKNLPTKILSALVPNLQGMHSAIQANAQHRVIDKVSVFTAASETFAHKNTNASIAQTIERFVPVLASAREHRLLVRGYVSCVIACPFEGAILPSAVRRVADQLWELGVDEIDLGDTIGAGDSSSMHALLNEFRQWPTRRTDHPSLTLHLHDTFGHAADCVKVALDMGMVSFDGSVAGLGGCPYASLPGKPAPGNISTELLVRTLRELGFSCGVDEGRLEATAMFARQIVAGARSGV